MSIIAYIADIMPVGSLTEIKGDFKYEIWPYLRMLCFAIASIIGLVAAIRVYNIWNINGRHHVHIDAQVIGWAAAAIFLIIATAFVNNVLISN